MDWRNYLQRCSTFGCCYKEDSKVTIVGAPLDISATYKPGTRLAPERIRVVSCNLELYSTFTDTCLEDTCFNDLGDLALPPGDLWGSLEILGRVVEGLFNEYTGSTPIFIGGEHTITYPIVRYLRKNVDTVIVFDAHLDLRDVYMGSRWNHSTVFRRLCEDLRLPIVYFGSRAISLEEKIFAEESGLIEIHGVREISAGVKIGDYGRIYVSIDMDVLDPSYAPGVSNPEPIGITPIQLIETLGRIVEASDKLIGVDIVETNPLVDVNDVTSALASKIVFELAGLIKRKTL